MRRRILIVTCEMLPVPGYPASGGAIRARGLGQGLESRGHQVIYSVPREIIKGKKNIPKYLTKYAYSPSRLKSLVTRIAPDIVLFEQWGVADNAFRFTDFCDLSIPIIIDLHGSLIIEHAFRGHHSFLDNARAKITALQKADMIICAGERQKTYFLSWLMMAGMDPKEIRIASVPVSLSPHLPKHRFSNELTFVYGGTLWPWIDSMPSLEVLVRNLERAGKGRLKLFIGNPPKIDGFSGRSLGKDKKGSIDPSFRRSKYVDFPGIIPHDQLLREYQGAHAALDVYKRNSERELAFTTRTVEYLWCGLPVIYADYAQLSPLIRDYRAGWIVDPLDKERIEKVIREIIRNPRMVRQYGENAQRLVREQLTWDKTIGPLDDFCQNPFRRPKQETIFVNLEAQIRDGKREMEQLKEHLKTEARRLKEELKDLKKRLNEELNSYERARKKLQEEQEAEAKRLKEELNNYERARTKLHEEQEAEARRLKEELNNREREMEQLKEHQKKEIKSRDQETWRLNEQIKIILVETGKKIEAKEATVEDVNRRLQDSGRHIGELQVLIKELQDIIKERETMAEDINRNLQNAGRHIGELQDLIKEREAVNEDLNRRLLEFGKHIGELQGITKERAAMIENANESLRESGEHIKELQDIIKERETIIADANESLQESGEHIKELQAIIRERDSRLMKSAQALSEKEAALGVTKDELRSTGEQLELAAGALRNLQSKSLYKMYKFVVRR